MTWLNLLPTTRPVHSKRTQSAAPLQLRALQIVCRSAVAAPHVLLVQNVLVAPLQYASLGILIGRSKPVYCETRRRHKLHPVLIGRFGLWPPKILRERL